MKFGYASYIKTRLQTRFDRDREARNRRRLSNGVKVVAYAWGTIGRPRQAGKQAGGETEV